MESLHYNLQDNNLSTKTIVQSTDCISASSRRHCSPFRNDWASIVKEGLALVLSVEHWGTKIKPSFPYQKDWRTSSNWDYMCDLVNYSRTYWPLIFWRTFEMTLFCLNWEFDFFFFFNTCWSLFEEKKLYISNYEYVKMIIFCTCTKTFRLLHNRISVVLPK